MTELEKELNRRADIIIRQEKQIEIDAGQIRALQKKNGALTDRVNEATEIIREFLVEKTQNVYTPKEWESLIAKAEAFLKETK